MKKLFFSLAMVACSMLAMAQTQQITWVNGRAVLGQSIDGIDSLKYGVMQNAQQLVLWLPESVIVHDTVRVPYAVEVHDTIRVETFVHDTVYVNICPDEPVDNTPEGVEMVDLGLPSGLKWANMNIGATAITEYGDYFAWGETEPKSSYSISTYKYYMDLPNTDLDGFDDTIHGYTKYVRSSDASQYGFNGFYDDKTTLDPEDDAAHVILGGNWRMPTKAEQDELRTNCTWAWVTLNGVNGYKVTGLNGNWIFLPAAGYRSNSSLYSAGSSGMYWSSSLSSNYCYAYFLYFTSGYVDWNSTNRDGGHSVRPVCQ